MTEETVVQDELESLKTMATAMGITFHPNIGVDALRKRVNDARADSSEEDEVEEEDVLDIDADIEDVDEAAELTQAVVPTEQATPVPAPVAPRKESVNQKRLRIKREATKLVRIRIQCMNPNKKEYEGEFFCTGNKATGTLKKYVPYGEPWHVPNIVLTMIQERMCQVFYTVREGGQKVRRGKLIKEFAVEILPSLNQKELKDLAQRQAMANGTSD